MNLKTYHIYSFLEDNGTLFIGSFRYMLKFNIKMGFAFLGKIKIIECVNHICKVRKYYLALS
jgi:hypothetical protein